jgi:hypothetical protein
MVFNLGFVFDCFDGLLTLLTIDDLLLLKAFLHAVEI